MSETIHCGRRGAWLFMAALVAVCALAPTSSLAAKATGAKSKVKVQAAKPEADAAKEEKAPVDPVVTADLVGAGYRLSGNDAKLHQYATPPRGAFFGVLALTPAPFGAGNVATAVLKGVGQSDYVAEGSLAIEALGLRMTGLLSRARFATATWGVIDDANRLNQEASVRQRLPFGWNAAFNYAMDERNQGFISPRWPENVRIKTWDLSAAGHFGPGTLGLGYSNLHFWDRTSIQPETEIRKWEGGYETGVGPLAVGIGGSTADVLLAGVKVAKVETGRLNTDAAVTPNTDLTIALQRDWITQPTVTNAYVRQQRNVNVGVVQRLGNWNLKLGVREREAERVNGPQTYIDVPKWWTMDARLIGKLSREARLQLKVSDEWLTDPPASSLPGAGDQVDTRSLYWSHRASVQAKLEAGPANANGYLAWAYRRAENGARNSTMTSDSVTAGGNWQINGRLAAFGELSLEGLSITSEITDVSQPTNFAPTTRTSVLGLSWVLGSATWASATYTDWSTNAGNPMRLQDGNTYGRGLTLSLEHRLHGGAALSLLVSPMVYRDKVISGMNYDTTVFRLSGRTRF